MELPHYISKGIIADLLGVTRQRVDQLEKRGQLPPHDATGEFFKASHNFWLQETIEEWAAAKIVLVSRKPYAQRPPGKGSRGPKRAHSQIDALDNVIDNDSPPGVKRTPSPGERPGNQISELSTTYPD